MGVLRDSIYLNYFYSKRINKLETAIKTGFMSSFIDHGPSTINIGFTNQDPSCRAGSHKSSSVFLTILLVCPDLGRE